MTAITILRPLDRSEEGGGGGGGRYNSIATKNYVHTVEPLIVSTKIVLVSTHANMTSEIGTTSLQGTK